MKGVERMLRVTNEELALAYQRGDTTAAGQLWEQNQGYIVLYCRNYYRLNSDQCQIAGVTVDDLQQEAYFAVIAAAKAYDPATGYKFLSFLKYPLKNVFNALIGFRGKRDPLNNCSSLDEPIGEEGDETKADFLADAAATQDFDGVEEAIYNQELRQALDAAIATLHKPQQEVIRGRYLAGHTLVEQSAICGISVSAVQQRERSALRAMRNGKAYSCLSSFAVDYGRAYRGTGWGTWNNSGSIEERILEWAEQREQTKIKKETIL